MRHQFNCPAFEVGGIGPGPDTGLERSRQSTSTEASGLFNDPVECPGWSDKDLGRYSPDLLLDPRHLLCRSIKYPG